MPEEGDKGSSRPDAREEALDGPESEPMQTRVRSMSRSPSRSPSHGRLTREQPNPVSVPQPHLASTVAKPPALDRQKVCPMYVRLFCRLHGHHAPAEFGRDRAPAADELTIYTWRDATLAELADLIKEVNVECRRRDAAFDFQLVYADLRGRYCFKPMGKVFNGRRGKEENRTLEEVRFLQGDFVDVAITFGPTGAIYGTGGVASAVPLAGAKRRSADWSDRTRGGSFGPDKRRALPRGDNLVGGERDRDYRPGDYRSYRGPHGGGDRHYAGPARF